MSTPTTPDPSAPTVDDVLEPQDDARPAPIAKGHAGQPGRLDDDALAAATEQERVDAGIADYAPGDVPDATDPLPAGSADAADVAQRGL